MEQSKCFEFQSRKGIKGADWFKGVGGAGRLEVASTKNVTSGVCSCLMAPSRRSLNATVTQADVQENLRLETTASEAAWEREAL